MNETNTTSNNGKDLLDNGEEVDSKENEENLDTDNVDKAALSEDEDVENGEEHSEKDAKEIDIDSNSNNDDHKENLDANNSDENGESENEGDINEDNYDSDGLYDDEILAAMQLSMADMGDNMKDNRGKVKKASVNGNINHNNISEKKDDDDMTVEGEPVEVDYPFDMDCDENPLDEDDEEYINTEEFMDQGDYNGDGIGVDENTSDFLDQVNGGSIAQSSKNSSDYVKQMRAPRGPYKKTRIRYGLDTTIKKSKIKVTTPSKADEVYFKCERCSFPFECLGELKIHMFSDHEDQEKPSYLDLAEVAIVKLNKKWGTSRSSIVAEILADPLVTDMDTPDVAKKKLDRALRSGVQKGRLRTSQSNKKGTKGYWIVGKVKRKELLARYAQNKDAVDYKDIEIISPEKLIEITPKRTQPQPKPPKNVGIEITPLTPRKETPPDPKKFGRGKRVSKPSPRNFGEITLADSSSDEEIAIISEKITPKTKLKLMQQKNNKTNAFFQLKNKNAFLKHKNKVNSTKVGQIRTVKNGVSYVKTTSPQVSTESSKEDAKKPEEEKDFFEDDEDLSCRLCLSTFWYKTEIMEHLKQDHNVDDPEKYLKTKTLAE